MGKFVAVIESGAVRGAQFCNNVVTDPMRQIGRAHV